MSQQPSRPWFRLASMVRPPPPPSRPPVPSPAPAPAPVQLQPFRPQVPLTQAGQPTPRPPAPIFPTVTPRTSAPPSPIRTTTPAPESSPVASPPPPGRTTVPPALPPPQATAAPSQSKTPILISPATQSPKSPAKTGEIQSTLSTVRSAQSPPPPISYKPTSPITKTTSSLPASPGQKVSPQIAVTRPEASYSSLPSSPKTKPTAPPPSPLQTSPPFKTVPSSPVPPPPSPVRRAAPIPTVTARASIDSTPIIVSQPTASPKINKPWVETPPQSTKEKLLSHPPSPLTLPPAQIKSGSDLEPIPAEIEQKTVTEEKSKTTPKTSNGYVIRSHGETHINNIAHQHGKREFKKDKGVHTHTQKKHSDTEEFGARVVTLAGENKGAMMELSPSSKKKMGLGAWINGGQKLKSNSDEEGSRLKVENHKGAPTETAPMDAFINCNVQGVNNSILYNCSCTHNDPGVHLSVSRKRNGGHEVHH